MEKSLRIAQYGCGKMAAYTTRYAQEKGAQIVAAFDIRPELIGKELGEIRIQHADEAECELKRLRPDAVIITTMSLLQDVEAALMLCAKLGIHAITTCEEAFFPGNSSPKLTAKLNQMARESGCTLCGSGYQDVFWGNLITTLAGATHKLTRIVGSSSYNVEDYGIALARAHGAGLTPEEFARDIAAVDDITPQVRQKLIDAGTFLPSYMWNVNGWLCEQLGLHVTDQRQQCKMQSSDRPLRSETLGMTVPVGHATGMAAVVTTTTREGITLETECIGKVYASNEFDRNRWILYGEPETQVVIDHPQTVELTCATVVNRLPDLINAPSGYYTTDRMPVCRYRVEPLHHYVAQREGAESKPLAATRSGG
ncbi:MAG TPA: dihydrodipicolinate reductase [Clostridia bacterium]|nr:dihydrodipicolinate reductase [Clostridia bacterium]